MRGRKIILLCSFVCLLGVSAQAITMEELEDASVVQLSLNPGSPPSVLSLTFLGYEVTLSVTPTSESFDPIDVTVVLRQISTPEPGTAALLLTGLVGLGYLGRKR